MLAVQAPPPPGTLVISRVNIVDVAAGRILPNRVVTIRGDSIVSVTESGAARPAGVDFDGGNGYLIPGLWDVHAHTEASGSISLPVYLANGITGIRDLGSDLDLILALQDSTARGTLPGPRIVPAGPILDDAPGDWPFRWRVRTAEEGRAAVRRLAQRGVSLVKVHDNTPREVYFAIAEEARRSVLRLTGHVPRAVTLWEAVDAGQLGIEHLTPTLWRPCSGAEGYRTEGCRPLFDSLARRGVWVTPTLGAIAEIATIGTAASAIPAKQLRYAGESLRTTWAGNQKLFGTPTAQAIEARRVAAARIATIARDMADAGIGILAGCDALIPGFCVADELEALVRGGMTPLAALRTATLNPVRYLGLERTTGAVAPGQRADLVLLTGNPLVTIGAVRRVGAVVRGGRLLRRDDLDRLLESARGR